MANSNSFPNNVGVYDIDGITGALTPVAGSPFADGNHPFSVAVDRTGKFAYVANFATSGNVSTYSIDATTGALTPLAGSPFAAGRFLARWRWTARTNSSMSRTLGIPASIPGAFRHTSLTGSRER